jgi:hypothetical protein
LIFENIDKYLEELDLFVRLTVKEGKLEEVLQENRRLIEENEGYRNRENTRNIMRDGREEQARKMDAFYQRQDDILARAWRNISGLGGRNDIQKWMNDFENAPDHFKNWVEARNLIYLNYELENSHKWPSGFIKIVEAALKVAKNHVKLTKT